MQPETSGTDEQISRRVRGALAEQNVTGVELAHYLGTTQSYVSRRVTGAVPWRAGELKLIASLLRMELGQLVGSRTGWTHHEVFRTAADRR